MMFVGEKNVIDTQERHLHLAKRSNFREQVLSIINVILIADLLFYNILWLEMHLN